MRCLCPCTLTSERWFLFVCFFLYSEGMNQKKRIYFVLVIIYQLQHLPRKLIRQVMCFLFSSLTNIQKCPLAFPGGPIQLSGEGHKQLITPQSAGGYCCGKQLKMKRRKGTLTVLLAVGMLTSGDPALSFTSCHWSHSDFKIRPSLACGAGQAGTET